jgi:hypothetical protein
MRRKLIIPVLILILFSCEKTSDPEILKFYGDAYEDIGYSIAKTDHEYLIAGQYTRLTRDSLGTTILRSQKKLVVVRTGLNCIESGKDTLPGNIITSGAKIITLEDGSAVVAGYKMNSDPRFGKDIYIVKVAPGGEGYTERSFPLEGNQYANDIIRIDGTNGGYLILATTDVERGATGDLGNAKEKKDVLLVHVNNNLDIVKLSEPKGFIGNDEGFALKSDGNNGFLVVGTTDRYQKEEDTGTDIFIWSFNEELSNTNSPVISDPYDQAASDFEIFNDGILIAGTSKNKEGALSGRVWNIEGSIQGGAESHDIELNGSGEQFIINAICRYKTNSLLMAGQYGSASSGSMLIFATDRYGYPVPGKVKIAGGTGNQVSYDVISDGEDIITVGKNAYENNSMITLLKFRF